MAYGTSGTPPKEENSFREHVVHEIHSGNTKSRGHWRVGMHHRLHIHSALVYAQVHPDLGRCPTRTRHLTSLKVEGHEICLLHIDLAEPRRRHEHVTRGQTHADIAVLPRNESRLIQPSTHPDNRGRRRGCRWIGHGVRR
jgi:hypothetical protein